jgi:hypothetical protein
MQHKPTIHRSISRAVLYRQTGRAIAGTNNFTASKKQLKSLSLLWYGFIISTLSYMLSTMETFISGAACQGIQVAGLALIIAGSAGLMKFKFDNKYLQNIFTLFIFFSLFIVVRGIQTDTKSLKKLFLDFYYGLFPYLAPLALLLPRNIGVYKKLFNVLIIFGVLFFIGDIVFYKIIKNPDWLSVESLGVMESLFGLYAFPVGFILLTFVYHKKKINWFAFAVMAIALFFLAYRARRGSMFLCLTTCAGAGMIYLIYSKKKALVISMSIFLVLFGSFFMSGIKPPAMFNFLMARGDEDTRSGVEQYMQADMTSKDWILGKGINGKYYCPIVINVDGSSDREVIETGYLQIILKGGLTSIILMGLILLPAVYKGLFKSKNVLAKGSGMFILLWMLYLYPTIGVGFTMHYILVWVSVGICYSKQICDMDDGEIKQYLALVK